MNLEDTIRALDQEWDQVESLGFFGKIKFGKFDEQGFLRVREILDSVEIPDGDLIDKRFIELTWFIPTFLHWQRPAWETDGKDLASLDRAIDFFQGRLTTILGLP